MERLEKIIWGEDTTALGRAIRGLSQPFGACYGVLGRARAKLFEIGVIHSYRAPAMVISVGNLTLGGTGKTPLVTELTKLCMAEGLKPVIVTRGYKGKTTHKVKVVSAADDADLVGDEPLLMARTLQSVPIIKSTSRKAGMIFASEKFSPDVFILDDGFGHLKVKRDIDIVIVDVMRGFGNRKVFPAGPLREPLSALKRADIIALRMDKGGQTSNHKKIEEDVVASAPKAHILKIVAALGEIFFNDEKIKAETLEKKRCLLFSGIANPRSFDSLVRAAGLKVLGHIAYADHHKYTKNDVNFIIQKAKESGADALLTTEKDAVKLDKKLFINPPLFVARMNLEVSEKEWLTELIKSKTGENPST